MTRRKTATHNNKNSSGTERGAPSFLRAHGLDLPALRARLNALDWFADDALAQARAELALFVGTVAELLKADARAHRQAFATRFTTLLVAAPLDERGLLALALATLESDAPVPGINATHRRVLATQPLHTHQRLLRDGTLPAARIPDIADADADARLTLYARELAGSAATLKLLKFAITADAAEKSLPRSALIKRLRRVQSLLRADHQPLDYPSFRKLPAHVREALLFTPPLCAFFLTAEAQAAARPPSPDCDPLFIEHALTELQRGRLSHVDLDTLFLAPQTPALQTRIVTALAEGNGDLRCGDDVLERLIAGSASPAFALIACAAARHSRDVQRALAQLPGLPRNGVLGEALHRFAQIAWCDASPADLPAALRADPALTQEIFRDCCNELLRALHGEGSRLPPASVFRQLTAWLRHADERAHANKAAAEAKRRPRRRQQASGLPDIPQLAESFKERGSRFAAEIDGHDLHALYLAGDDGKALATVLAGTLRKHNHARWIHGYFTRLAGMDARTALAIIGNAPDDDEAAILAQESADRP